MSDASLHQVWSETELDDALDALHPDAPSADLSAIRATLMSAAGAAPAEQPPAAKPRRTWAWVAAAASVIVLAGGIVAVSNLASGPAEPSLLQLGSTGAVEADAPLKPGQVRYLYEQRWGSPVYGERYETIVEQWLPEVPGQEWLRRETSTGRSVPYPGPDAATATPKLGAGPPEVTEKHGPLDGGPGSFFNPTPRFLASLRQDPTWLYEQLHTEFDKGKPQPMDVDVFTFRTIVDLLTSGKLPASYRVLFARTLSLVPGFVTRNESDRTTYIFERGNERTTLVLKTSTGLPITLTVTTVYDDDAYKAGTPLRESHFKTAISERPTIPTTTTTKPN
ncbi:hypothetical protein AB5J62_39275 [Amycolatopsis sp. cg5]|uniref:hypothetical protein n=1 Tax=Amycolatopsis sp. cg5 TaxID=3238802 RepID=UPI0035238B48